MNSRSVYHESKLALCNGLRYPPFGGDERRSCSRHTHGLFERARWSEQVRGQPTTKDHRHPEGQLL